MTVQLWNDLLVCVHAFIVGGREKHHLGQALHTLLGILPGAGGILKSPDDVLHYGSLPWPLRSRRP